MTQVHTHTHTLSAVSKICTMWPWISFQIMCPRLVPGPTSLAALLTEAGVMRSNANHRFDESPGLETFSPTSVSGEDPEAFLVD